MDIYLMNFQRETIKGATKTILVLFSFFYSLSIVSYHKVRFFPSGQLFFNIGQIVLTENSYLLHWLWAHASAEKITVWSTLIYYFYYLVHTYCWDLQFKSKIRPKDKHKISLPCHFLQTYPITQCLLAVLEERKDYWN